MRPRRTIRVWLLRHLSWLSLGPALGVALALSAVLIPAIYEDIASENLAFRDAVLAEATQMLLEPSRELELVAGRLHGVSDPAEIERILAAASFANLSFDALYVAGPDNRIVASALPQANAREARQAELRGLDVSGWAHVQEARTQQRTVWSDTHLSALSGKITVALAVPRDGQVLVAEIGLERLSEFAERVANSGHVMVVVLDRRGQVVAHPDERLGLQQVNFGNLPPVVQDARPADAPRRFEIGGQVYLGAAATIPGPDWSAIVGQPFDRSQARIKQAILVIAFAAIAIGALAWVLAARLSRRLADPLAALVAHSEQVARGNYDAQPPDAPWPELDRLREAMDKMVRSIVLRERALLTTEHRYRALVDGIDDLIVQFDLQALAQFTNPAAEYFIGKRPGACLGLSLYEMVDREESGRTRRQIAEWIDSEDWRLSLETRLRADGGHGRRALWSFTKEFDDAGNLSGFRGIARDITEIRRGQDALRGLIAGTARESGEEFFRSLVRHMARTLDVEHALVAERDAEGHGMRTLAVWSGHAFIENFAFPVAGTVCERLLNDDRGVVCEAIDGDCCPTPLCTQGPISSFLGATLRDSHGNRLGALVVLSERDLSVQQDFAQLVSIFADRAAMELMRQHSEANLRLAASVFESSAEGILITDAAHHIISANAACQPITGYAPGELIGNTPRLFRSGRHGDEFYHELDEALQRDGQWTGEVWNRRKDGHVYPQWMTVTVVKNGAGEIENYIASFFDISARKEAEARIHFLAHHDALTGLPNRVLLQDRLGQAISIARREELGVAVMFLDLDRFKLINDSLGHDVGDALLEEVALRLTRCLREGETVARLGGDEFVIVLPRIERSEQASMVAGRILGVLGVPIEIRDQVFHVTSSIGISVFPDDGEAVETLLRNADTAMYHAKELGRNNFQYYTEALNARVTERVHLESDMRRGLEQREFVVHYQPQVDARSGEIIGAEALVRWQHPEQGMISPARFIPIAEDTGLIVPLGEFVMIEACRQAAAWNQRMPGEIRMGVNLSARQFSTANLLDTVNWALDTSGLRPDLLELEITESMLMEDPAQATALLEQLSRRGVRLAIDDFGTGYSSLAYLRRFPIDRLKVDQSFIRDLSSDPNDAAIVRAVISLAHTLNLEVIAEGVETLEHLAKLREWGCFDVQGFLFSKPLEPAAFERFCAQAAKDRILA